MSDQRAKLRVKGGYSIPFNGPGAALRNGNGIIFPFTPTINYQHQSEYSQYELVHSNYAINSFVKSRPGNIQISAPFHHQTTNEAIYTVAVMHFLKVCSKMNFGANDSDAGTPPPLLEFSAYGPINFERVPVFIGSYSFSYPEDVDYVKVDAPVVGGVELPVSMIISVDLIPHYPPSMTTEQFSIAQLASGELYRGGFI